jgi:hypothetical protein
MVASANGAGDRAILLWRNLFNAYNIGRYRYSVRYKYTNTQIKT